MMANSQAAPASPILESSNVQEGGIEASGRNRDDSGQTQIELGGPSPKIEETNATGLSIAQMAAAAGKSAAFKDL